MKIPVPKNESDRLGIVTTYHVVETEQDERLDELTKLAASIFDVPMVIITILDKSRQWFKSKYGLGLRETSRDISFCQYTIMNEDIFEVPDTKKDRRFKNNPLVLEDPNIRYYCGAPLVSKEGYALGSVGLLDHKPRKIDRLQRRSLMLLAKQIVDHFELNRDKKELEKQKSELEETVRNRTREIQQKLDEILVKDEKLDALNNEINKFMYKASHDLRGPLKTMLGLSQLALAEAKEESVKPYLQLLQGTQQKLDKTLDHLLSVVQIKKHQSVLKPVDPYQLIQDLFKKTNNGYPEKKIDFKCLIRSKRGIISDIFLLEKALEQILFNAVQFNFSDRASIAVKVTDEGENTRIDIRDNGAGIPDEEKPHVFDMFFKSRSTGSGLGLYIAKNAIDRMGGNIFFTSEKYKGTTFTIILPFSSHINSKE